MALVAWFILKYNIATESARSFKKIFISISSFTSVFFNSLANLQYYTLIYKNLYMNIKLIFMNKISIIHWRMKVMY